MAGTDVGPYTDIYGFGKTCCFALLRTPHPTYQDWCSLGKSLAELLGNCVAETPEKEAGEFREGPGPPQERAIAKSCVSQLEEYVQDWIDLEPEEAEQGDDDDTPPLEENPQDWIDLEPEPAEDSDSLENRQSARLPDMGTSVSIATMLVKIRRRLEGWSSKLLALLLSLSWKLLELLLGLAMIAGARVFCLLHRATQPVGEVQFRGTHGQGSRRGLVS